MKEILLKNQSKNLEYIPLSEAGHILNTSRDYMNVLVRRGKLRAVKLGRNWFTTNEWLSEFRTPTGKLEQEEKAELASLREVFRLHRDAGPFFTEREKQLQTEAFLPEIKLSSRELNPKKNLKFLKRLKNSLNLLMFRSFKKFPNSWGF